MIYKNIQFLKYSNGQFGIKLYKCTKGHITNYLIGNGWKNNPFHCPVCSGYSKTIKKELKRINSKLKKEKRKWKN